MTRLTVCLLALAAAAYAQDAPLRIAIAGLAHGHVSGFLNSAVKRQEVKIVAIFNPDAALVAKYGTQYKLPKEAQFTDLGKMLDAIKPEAVATFTSTYDHAMVVKAAAQRRIPVMMEKPLATDMKQARAIQQAAARGGIPVIVNYETTWYRSHGEIWKTMKQQKAGGEIRKMVAMDGHEGPKEIGVQPEFFAWLTDPVKNGAGALFDFGCYGANIMTWLMDGERPRAVTAMRHHFKPAVYPRVDDEATILLEYPRAQGIIQASWNWPFNRKDFEVYADHGSAVATTGGGGLKIALPNEPEHAVTPDPRPADERDSISHLMAVVRKTRKPNALSSLENNVIVTEILEAARQSARTHARVTLGGSQTPH